MLRIFMLVVMLGLWSGSAWAAEPSMVPPGAGGGSGSSAGGDYETGGAESGSNTDGVGDNVVRKQYTVQDATNAALDQNNTVSITYK